MQYLFICPKCKRKENIEMRMIDYTDLGHYCNNCGLKCIEILVHSQLIQ